MHLPRAGRPRTWPAPDTGRGQLDGTRRHVELDVDAGEALGHGQAPVEIELLGGGHVRRPEQEHDLVDLPGHRAAVLLGRRRDLPDRPVRRLYDAAVPPEPSWRASAASRRG